MELTIINIMPNKGKYKRCSKITLPIGIMDDSTADAIKYHRIPIENMGYFFR
jgi:hypothetical protein